MDNRTHSARKSEAFDAVEAYRSTGAATDPLGSYTGLVHDGASNPSVSSGISNGVNMPPFYLPGGGMINLKMSAAEPQKPTQDADDL